MYDLVALFFFFSSHFGRPQTYALKEVGLTYVNMRLIQLWKVKTRYLDNIPPAVDFQLNRDWTKTALYLLFYTMYFNSRYDLVALFFFLALTLADLKPML